LARAKRIGLNGLFLDYPYSGTWTYTRNLTRALLSLAEGFEFTLYVRRGEPSDDLTKTAVRPLWPFSRTGSHSSWLERLDKVGWETVALPLSSRHDDLLHNLYFTAPPYPSGSMVVTVHDVISLDQRHRHSQAAGLYARLMSRAIRRAHAVIAVSNHSKWEIANRLGYPERKIHVVHEAPDPSMAPVEQVGLESVRRRYGLPERYFLYLGGTERRKNIEVLIRSWSMGPPPASGLVIVGRFRGSADPLYPDIPGQASCLAHSDTIHFVSSADQADLAALYSGALAFCYPSTYEGFGLPPVEAMACGAPVLAANATSLPEVLGPNAQLLDPNDAAAWNRAMHRMADDPAWRTEVSRQGLQRAREFSWAKTARETIAVYQTVLGR